MKRTILITGANSGIGRDAAAMFAERGDTVIMACRSIERSEPVRDAIRNASGNPDVDLLSLDMSSLSSVRDFAARIRSAYPVIDGLINNAAYVEHGSPYRLSPDGIEMTIATNAVAPWLLTKLLRGPLSRSSNPRVLNAGSNIIKHFFDPGLSIDFSNLRGEEPDRKGYSVYGSYRDSKLALLMLTFHLAEEMKADGICVNMLQINGARMSPETIRKFTPRYRMAAHVQNLFFRPASFMAARYVEIITSPRFADVTGKLINHKLEIMQPGAEKPGLADQFRQLAGAGYYPPSAHDRDAATRVLEFCEKVTAMAEG
jgi:NAD(P)-dependent dehydrogenase (short-subunit alcohol dehydrogenase family)